MLTFALLAHWLACIWFVIGDAEQPDYSQEVDLQFPGKHKKYLSEIQSANLFFMKSGLFRLKRLFTYPGFTRSISGFFLLNFVPKLSRISGNAGP